MSRYIVLDSGPLGLITNPKGSTEALRSNEWLRTILSEGSIVVVPEIADYEVRRELKGQIGQTHFATSTL